MLPSLVPVGQFFVIGFFLTAPLVERVAQIVRAVALETGIPRKQRLAKGLERLVVILQPVCGRARIELDFIRCLRLRMLFQRLRKLLIGILKFFLPVRIQSRRASVRGACSEEENPDRGHKPART